MTREEEIHKAYKRHLLSEGMPKNGFEYGARWADEHPKNPWISAEERLPEDGQLILYTIPRKPYWFYDTVYYPEPHITDEIKYWMPIPKLPKED